MLWDKAVRLMMRAVRVMVRAVCVMVMVMVTCACVLLVPPPRFPPPPAASCCCRLGHNPLGMPQGRRPPGATTATHTHTHVPATRRDWRQQSAARTGRTPTPAPSTTAPLHTPAPPTRAAAATRYTDAGRKCGRGGRAGQRRLTIGGGRRSAGRGVAGARGALVWRPVHDRAVGVLHHRAHQVWHLGRQVGVICRRGGGGGWGWGWGGAGRRATGRGGE